MNVNGYWVERIECTRLWGVMLVGAVRGGRTFRTRGAAIAWACKQVTA